MNSTSTAMPNGPIYRFENIGPIASAELELGDLTIIAGRNNTGKTYLVYALYGFLAKWPFSGSYTSLSGSSGLVTVPKYSSPVLDRMVDSVAKRGKASIPVNQKTLIAERKTILQQICSAFSNLGLADVFNAPEEYFSETSLNIELASPAPQSNTSTDFWTRPDGRNIIRYDGGAIDVVPDVALRQRIKHPDSKRISLAREYIRFLFPEFMAKPVVLTSERYGISLFYKELDRNRNDIVDAIQKARRREKKDVEDILDFVESASSRYFLPIHDNIRFTRDIARLAETRGRSRGKKLSKNIDTMMKGKYRISDDDIMFVPKSSDEDEVALPLYRASSSVRELSDFYFFLRRLADRYNLLVIDEPESHLDTANQIGMARLLVRAVNAGLKVLITTHSDYIIKELNNLIMMHNLGDNPGKKAARKHRYASGDRLDPARIRAYVAESSSITRCEIDQYGIGMPVFDDTIDSINRVANDLASRLAVESNDY